MSRDETSLDEAADPAWPVRLLPRTGAPPLRFNGRRVAHHCDGVRDVSLWAVMRGGYVAAVTLPGPDGPISHARRTKSLDRAMTEVEEICADAARSPAAGPRTAADLIARARRGDEARRLAELAGDALAAWDRWAASGAPLSGGHGG